MDKTDGLNDSEIFECNGAFYPFGDRMHSLLSMTTACISLVAVCVTMRECVADLRKPCRTQKKEQAVPAFIFSLNVGLFAFFFGKMFGPLPGPRVLNEACGVWGTYGTVETCTAQSFIIQIGSWSYPFQFCSLIFIYMGIVRYGWTEKQLKTRVTWLLCFIWTLSIAMAVTGLYYKVFNFKDQNCWVNMYPAGCLFTGNCVRGGMAAYIYHLAAFAPMLVIVAASILWYLMIFCAVRKVEKNASRWSSKASKYESSNLDHSLRTSAIENISRPPLHRRISMRIKLSRDDATVNRLRSKAVAKQAAALTFMAVVLLVVKLVESYAYKFLDHQGIYRLHIFRTCLDNFQGLILFVVFADPRKKMATREGKVLRKVLFRPFSILLSFLQRQAGSVPAPLPFDDDISDDRPSLPFSTSFRREKGASTSFRREPRNSIHDCGPPPAADATCPNNISRDNPSYPEFGVASLDCDLSVVESLDEPIVIDGIPNIEGKSEFDTYCEDSGNSIDIDDDGDVKNDDADNHVGDDYANNCDVIGDADADVDVENSHLDKTENGPSL